jgi:23S rRNA (uracil1939-C5)-methyltransferase
MLPYEQQLKYKQQQVADNLRRIGKVELPGILPIVGAEETRRYRNKMEYTFSNKRFLLPEELNNPKISHDENVAGFHARGLFDKVVPIFECHLQAEPTNYLRLAVWDYAKQHGLSHYDIRNHTGYLRNLLVRIATTGEIMVNIVVGYEDKKTLFPLLEFLQGKFPDITTLLYTINPKKNDSLFDLAPKVFSGKGYIIEKMEDFAFKISPKSFFKQIRFKGKDYIR